jgi:antibiotic biosynthesis monooxygenase (ABM) superfamily enzyme
MGDAVTLLLEHRVKPNCVVDYESWVKEISAMARSVKGYEGVSIVRPHLSHTSYTILVRFDSHESLFAWVNSDVRRQLLARAAPLLLESEGLEIHTGLEFWFTPSPARPMHARPYKQFLITLSAIYPLTVVLPFVLQPLLTAAGLGELAALQGLLVTAVIVFLMVYLIMPKYTRLVARWLFD